MIQMKIRASIKKKFDLVSQLKLFENSLHYVHYEKALLRNKLNDCLSEPFNAHTISIYLR